MLIINDNIWPIISEMCSCQVNEFQDINSLVHGSKKIINFQPIFYCKTAIVDLAKVYIVFSWQNAVTEKRNITDSATFWYYGLYYFCCFLQWILPLGFIDTCLDLPSIQLGSYMLHNFELKSKVT